MLASLYASTSRAGVRALSSTARVATKAPLQPSGKCSPDFERFPTSHFAAEIAQPIDLLTKIGRNADKKLAEKAETWEGLNELWMKGTKPLAEAGLTPKERRLVGFCDRADDKIHSLGILAVFPG